MNIKKTGIEWLPEIPFNWSVVRCGDYFEQKNGRASNSTALLTCSIEAGVMPQEDYEEMTGRKLSKSLTEKDNYRKVSPGDIVYNRMRMWQGAIALSKYSGVVSPAYVVMRARNDSMTPYSIWLFKSSGFISQAAQSSYGICDDQNSLKFENFKQLLMPLPPLAEQEAIAAYLDRETALIDREVAVHQRKIDLLGEYRKALIFEAVTKGLDKNAPMKDSGVDWIGQVPAGWDLVHLKRIVEFKNGDWGEEPSSDNPGIICYRKADYQENNTIIAGATRRLVKREAFVQYGDVLIEKSGGGDKSPVGNPAIVLSEEPAICSNFMMRIRAKSNQAHFKFLFYGLYALHGSSKIYDLFKQTTGIQNIDVNDLMGSEFPLPSFSEQKNISQYLDRETALLDQEVKLIANKISLLKEYRKALIFEAVTGKKEIQ